VRRVDVNSELQPIYNYTYSERNAETVRVSPVKVGGRESLQPRMMTALV